MKFFKTAAAGVSLAAISLFLPHAGFGQATNSGDIRGTVTDPTGALVPGVTVTVVNVNTGITKVLTTNSDGLYDTSSIVVGTYSVTFEAPGFTKFSRSQITLPVGTSTVNAVLQIGSTNQEVVVNSDIPLLETESGTQQTTLEARSMQALPNVGQDWQNFAILIPGSSGVAGGVNPGQLISANGNLPYNNVLSDGATVTLGTSANADVNVFETVQEVQISTSAFSAQYGIGGIIFNQISKGGTSQFHGSAYEYFQSSQFNANAYQFGGQGNTLPFLRYNNFGASIGGPIAVPHTGLRKKAFFYFDYDQIINHGATNATNDVPTVDVLNGNFSAPGLFPIYDPTTQVLAVDKKGNQYPIRQTFASEYGSNSIPASMFDKVSANFKNFFPTPTNHIAGSHFQQGVLNTGLNFYQHNFYASVPVQSPAKRYFGRIDYDINTKNRLTFSLTQGNAPAFLPSTLSPAPVGTGSQDITRLNMQVTDVWTISPHLVNEARFGFTYQGNFFGDGTLGKGYPAQLGWQFAKADEIPGVQFQRNYSYAWIQPRSDQYVYKENVFDPSDVVTFIKGKHVLHFGGEVGIYRNDNTPYAQINPGTFQFNGNYTSHWSVDATSGVAGIDGNTGAEFADFLLGDAQVWSATNGGEYGARLKNPQVFIQDDYKVRPNLTLNLGVRYQVRLGISEVKGNVGSYDPTVLNPANNTLGAYWFGVTHANGRNNLQENKYNTVLPRVGFSYLPHPNMTIRGGFGLYAYNLSLDTYGYGLGAVSTSSGVYYDPTNGVIPAVKFDGPGTENINGLPLPYATPGTSPTRFNGQNAQYNQYNTPDPEIYQYNVGIQQTMGTNMVFNLSYVGSHAYHLSFPTDLNQVPVSLMSPTYNTRPNPNYAQINGSTNDAISNYNSMQAEINRRLARGLSLDFSYTWSHFLDDQDSSGWGSRSGPISRQYEDAPSNYSNSNFDVRNAFKGRIVYEVPIGRGRQFFNHNYLVDAILGGYQVSSTMQLQSGNPFTVFANGSNSNSEPGSNTEPFPNYSGAQLALPGGHSRTVWFNPAAFTLPAPGTFGNVRRNSLYGPGLEYVNISAGKRFDIYENVKLQVRLDATNAFNHPSFANPSGQLNTFGGQLPGQAYTQTGANTGVLINGVTVGGRNLQGGLRLEF